MIDLFGTVDESASPATFDDWYSIYPRKKGKMSARKTWCRRGYDSIADKILEHTQASIEHEWSELKYIPYASTYLHQERYLDAVEIAVAPVPKDLDEMVSYAAKRGVEAKAGEQAWEFRQRLEGMAG
jgi:hypothetical protein